MSAPPELPEEELELEAEPGSDPDPGSAPGALDEDEGVPTGACPADEEDGEGDEYLKLDGEGDPTSVPLPDALSELEEGVTGETSPFDEGEGAI